MVIVAYCLLVGTWGNMLLAYSGTIEYKIVYLFLTLTAIVVVVTSEQSCGVENQRAVLFIG